MIVAWIVGSFLAFYALARTVYLRAYRRELARLNPPLGLDLGPVAPFGMLDGETAFEDMARAYEAQRVKPYDYWRERWVETGDPEALRQMARFVEDT